MLADCAYQRLLMQTGEVDVQLPFLLAGHGAFIIINSIEAALQASFLGKDNAAGLRAAILFIFAICLIFSFTIDAAQSLYLSDIFLTHIRVQCMAVGMSGMYVGTIILLMAGPMALQNLGWKFFLAFVIPDIEVFLMIYFPAPETKHRSLEDIAIAFGDQVAVRYYGATANEEELYAKALEVDVMHDRSSESTSVDKTIGNVQVTEKF